MDFSNIVTNLTLSIYGAKASQFCEIITKDNKVVVYKKYRDVKAPIGTHLAVIITESADLLLLRAYHKKTIVYESESYSCNYKINNKTAEIIKSMLDEYEGIFRSDRDVEFGPTLCCFIKGLKGINGKFDLIKTKVEEIAERQRELESSWMKLEEERKNIENQKKKDENDKNRSIFNIMKVPVIFDDLLDDFDRRVGHLVQPGN